MMLSKFTVFFLITWSQKARLFLVSVSDRSFLLAQIKQTMSYLPALNGCVFSVGGRYPGVITTL